MWDIVTVVTVAGNINETCCYARHNMTDIKQMYDHLNVKPKFNDNCVCFPLLRTTRPLLCNTIFLNLCLIS